MYATLASLDRNESFANASERAIKRLRTENPNRWDFTIEEIEAALYAEHPELKRILPDLMARCRQDLACWKREAERYEAERPRRAANERKVRFIIATWREIVDRIQVECDRTGRQWYGDGELQARREYRHWQVEWFGEVLIA